MSLIEENEKSKIEGRVAGLHQSAIHNFSKEAVRAVHLLEGYGVEGDAHCGDTVQHLSRVEKDPSQPNLRQVHLLHSELLAELETEEIAVAPGQIGENVLTKGIDLLALPTGTKIQLGDDAELELTGLRNPCKQLNDVAPGLMKRLSERGKSGKLSRLAGVMAIVVKAGDVQVGDPIRIELPEEPHHALEPV